MKLALIPLFSSHVIVTQDRYTVTSVEEKQESSVL